MNAAARIETAIIAGNEVVVSWANAAITRFQSYWLRDHCHAPASLNPLTLQRQVDTFAIARDIAAARVEVQQAGELLRVHWSQGGSSELPAQFLWDLAQGHDGPAPRRRLWDREALGGEIPSVPYDEIMGTKAGLLRWLSLVEEYGLALASGTPVSVVDTQALVKRIGYIRETIFGGMWEFTADLAFQDTAYTKLAIGPHTDGTYSNDAPGYQLFHCLQFDGSGGENTLVDGFKVSDIIRRTDPEAFELLTTVQVPARYLGDGVHLRARHPIIGLDDGGNLAQIAYNNYDRAPFLLSFERMTAFYRALGVFNGLVNDPNYEICLRLAPGTALLFDNWRVLHGRRSYQGTRRLCGAYLNREEFDSKLRVLRAD
jgi:trimethyllysine dioxygenase